MQLQPLTWQAVTQENGEPVYQTADPGSVSE